MSNAVVVTGLGVVSTLGLSPEAFWMSLSRGVADAPIEANFSGVEKLSFSRGHYLSPKVRAQVSPPGQAAARASDYAVAATLQAVAAAGLDIESGGVIGTSFGSGMGDAQDWLVTRRSNGSHQDFIFRTADRVGEALDLDGPVFEVSTACAASAYAIAAGSMLLKAGAADIMICGGADAPNSHALAAFNRLGALDPEACRPFDQRRAGTVFGEGAAVLVLEREESFRSRGGTNALAWLEGFGMSCDAQHPTAPAEDGVQIERAMRQAIGQAGITPAAVRAAVPHATGTTLNDRVESAVMVRVFGRGSAQPWSLPIKGYTGHGGGMSGALSALTAVLMIAHDAVPPAAGPRCPDPECDIRLADCLIEQAGVQHVIVNAYAFGGSNVTLVFGRREVGEP
jgi:3-oxoacyl-[acyl-carrier-protein] synthase II